jgi:nucleoside-diphosphate-sugar epimerase
MILFTGSGKISDLFQRMYSSKIISIRKLNDKELKEAVRDSQTIIHNSALIYSNNFDDYIVSNFLLTRKIINICEEINPEIRFINLSSMSFLSDDSSCLPADQMTDYAYSKYISENYCLRSSLKNLTSVRFSTIYYGDENIDGISKLIKDIIVKNEITLFNNGIAKRDIIPIRILVMYLYKLCNVKTLSKKYNIVSGVQTSFMDIVNILLKYYPTLKISNKKVEANNVLCAFSKQDVVSLGEIDFSLEEEIVLNIKK